MSFVVGVLWTIVFDGVDACSAFSPPDVVRCCWLFA